MCEDHRNAYFVIALMKEWMDGRKNRVVNTEHIPGMCVSSSRSGVSRGRPFAYRLSEHNALCQWSDFKIVDTALLKLNAIF